VRVLIISDKKPGHLNQSISFCKLKGLEYDIVEVELSKIKKILSYLLDFLHIYIDIADMSLSKQNYKAVVSTGSSTYYINKYLAKKLNTKSIAIMLPRGFRISGFDYIFANKHDNPPKKDNIISIPINFSISQPKGYIKKSDKKSVGIIIGGNNSIFKMNKELIKKSLEDIFKKFPNHLKYITTSRRTPKEIEDIIDKFNFDYKLIYSKNPNINPIPDFIENCSELFITIDSTSMLSEARANSDADIHIIELPSHKKDTKFHKLAKEIEKLKGRFDYKPYLDRVKI